jgi:hypothetical protein
LSSIDLKIIDNNGVVVEDMNSGDDIDNHHHKVTDQRQFFQRKMYSNLIYLLPRVLSIRWQCAGQQRWQGKTQAFS